MSKLFVGSLPFQTTDEELRDAFSLVEGILFSLNNSELYDRKKIRENAVFKYDLNVQANMYVSLYNKIVIKDKEI